MKNTKELGLDLKDNNDKTKHQFPPELKAAVSQRPAKRLVLYVPFIRCEKINS